MTLSFIIIGISLWSLNVYAEEESSAESHKVIVEPSFVATTANAEGTYKLLPYVERRGKWGSSVSVGYSSYEPVNLESNFVAIGISQPYEKADTPLIEAQFTYKRNLPFGSVGGEIAIGMYSNASDDANIDSNLSLKILRLGANVALDTLYAEPYLAPYCSVGLYTLMFEETLGSVSHKGNTQVAPYATCGAMLQLDWIDKVSARRSYEDNGTQSSFLFIEGRQLFASIAEADKDYSSDLHWDAGIRVEF